MKPVQQKTYFEREIDENNSIKVSIEVDGYSINATRVFLAEIVDALNKIIEESQTEQ